MNEPVSPAPATTALSRGGPPASSRFIDDHLSLVVTGALFTAFVVKLVAVSHSNTTTMSAILQRTGPSAVLFGIAAQVGIWVAFGLLLGLGARLVDDGKVTDTTTIFALLGASAALVALLASVVLAGAVLLLGLAGLWRRRRRAPRGRGGGVNRQLAFAGLGSALALVLFLNDGVWLPAEALTTASGERHVGFVLDSDDSWTVLLREKDRVVVRLATGSIERRQYCSLGDSDDWWGRPFYALRESERPDYDPCEP
jgi:hypothetical protein